MAGGPTTPALVAAVSNAGGLGFIGAGYLTPEALRAAIREVKQLTRRSFAVNLFARPDPSRARPIGLHAQGALTPIAARLGVSNVDFAPVVPDHLDAHVAVLREEGVPIVSTTFGLLPESHRDLLQIGGAMLIGTATCVVEAIAVQEAGCAAVVVQGAEAGAHRGSFLDPDHPPLIGTMALVPQVADAVDIPVIASGGIMDGRGIAASLILGASAVQMGTAFLVTEESGADEAWKQALLRSDETSTALTRTFSGKFARGVRNEFMEIMEPFEAEVASYPIHNQITGPIRSAAKRQSNPEFMSLWGGQGVRMARGLQAGELVRALVEEVGACLAGVAG
jgi:nitronate monooxygenase